MRPELRKPVDAAGLGRAGVRRIDGTLRLAASLLVLALGAASCSSPSINALRQFASKYSVGRVSPPPAAIVSTGAPVESPAKTEASSNSGTEEAHPLSSAPPASVAGAPLSKGDPRLPYAIASDVKGDIWFTEYGENVIARIAPDRTLTRIDLERGGFPERIASSVDDSLWFSDPSGDRVGRIEPDHDSVSYVSMPWGGSGAGAISVSVDGAVWVSEHSADRIAQLMPDSSGKASGDFQEYRLPPGSGPAGLIVGSDRSVWFAENGRDRIGHFTWVIGSSEPTLAEFPVPTLHAKPNSVALGADGDLYFTELAANRIGRLTPGGEMTELALPVDRAALDILAGADDNIWATVPKAHALCRVSPDGGVKLFEFGTATVPVFIASDSRSGGLWFTEPNGKIGLFTPSASGSEQGSSLIEFDVSGSRAIPVVE